MGSKRKILRQAKEEIGAESYNLDQAIELLRKYETAKFDETVELHVRLGIDPTKADQALRGAVVLPRGLGKTVRVAVVAQGEKIKEAEEAGADFVGSEELIENIAGGWLDFDTMIATPDMMAKVAKVGRLLGPRGLMPNPKTGTVTFDIKQAVSDAKAGKVEYRVDKGANLHVAVGKKSFEPEAIKENIQVFMDTIMRAKPAASKGVYLRNVVLCSSMGPGISLSASQFRI